MEQKTAAGPISTKDEPRGNCQSAAEQRAIPKTAPSTRQAGGDVPALRVLATLGSEDDLRRALRAYVDELNVPRLELDRVAGLARAHTGRLLSLSPSKHFGSTSFWALVGAAGLKLILAVDPESRFPAKMTKRRRAPVGRAP
jgi:hypothetical protein